MEKISKNRLLKGETIEEIKSEIAKAKSVVLVAYKGLTVAEDMQIRTNFRNNGGTYKVYKNRLILRALNELGYTGLDAHLEGNTSLAISYDDEVAASRLTIQGIASSNNKLSAKVGIVNGKIVDSAYVEKLGNLPGREALIAQLLGVLQAPVKTLAIVLDQASKKSA